MFLVSRKTLLVQPLVFFMCATLTLTHTTLCDPSPRLCLQATSALREVLSVEEVEELVASRYAELAYTILTRVGSCANVKAGGVCQLASRRGDGGAGLAHARSDAVTLGTHRLRPFYAQGLSPVAAAIDAFKEFLDRSKSTFVFDILDENEAWPTLETQESNTEVRPLRRCSHPRATARDGAAHGAHCFLSPSLAGLYADCAEHLQECPRARAGPGRIL